MFNNLYVPAFCMENGSGFTKCGFSHQTEATIVPTRVENVSNSNKHTRPIDQGTCIRWPLLQEFWYQLFATMQVTTEETPMMLVEYLYHGSRTMRESKTQFFFESCNVPALFMCNNYSMSLWATGRTTGMVVDCGHDLTMMVPAYDSYVMPHPIRKKTAAGSTITNLLQQELHSKYANCAHLLTWDVVQAIKEQCCYVLPMNHDTKVPEQTYELPDKTVITVTNEANTGAEKLFSGPVYDETLQWQIHKSIQTCDVDLRQELFSNIVLCGGTSMLKGMHTRLTSEVKQMTSYNVQVHKMEPYYGAWVGASILSSLSSFLPNWVTLEEYNESGPSVMNRRCFY